MAEYQDGSHIRAVSSPRPYLHPVRTLAGTVVTDHQPLDHVWHLGVGVALQDVDGVNFWGGRTYTRAAGEYVWRPDHGSIVGHGTTRREETAARTGGRDGDELTETLSWNGPDGAPVLTEERTWTWARSRPVRLATDPRLCALPRRRSPVSLGSPGSNGRHQGGYGGFFWRLPGMLRRHGMGARRFAAGEAAVHGSVTPWLAWSGNFGAGTPDGGTEQAAVEQRRRRRRTLVFVAAEGSTDPWFVRVDGYPGVGQSLAWDTPVIAEPGTSGPPQHHGIRRRRDSGHRRHRNIDQTQGDRHEPDHHRSQQHPLGAPSGNHRGRTAPASAADRAIKRRRVLDILDAKGQDSLLLTTHTALTWYLDGSRVHISLAGDPIAALLVDRDGDHLVTFNNEAGRMAAEELPAGVTLHSVPWYGNLHEAAAAVGRSTGPA